MEPSGWILFAVLTWGFGYLKTKFGTPEDGDVLIVPRWVYLFVCGSPRSEELPKNTVLAIGLQMQIFGWLLIIFGLFISQLINNTLLSFIVGFVGSSFLSFVLSTLIARK